MLKCMHYFSRGQSFTYPNSEAVQIISLISRGQLKHRSEDTLCGHLEGQ